MSESGKPGSFWSRIQLGDKLAAVALVLSAIGLGWQIKDTWLRPDVSILSPLGRAVELRCTSGQTSCWGAEDGTAKPKGRTAIILPAFFINRGAHQQNEVITRLWANVTIVGTPAESLKAKLPAEFVGHAEWLVSETSGGRDQRPFRPILIEGRNAAGSEVRLIDFDKRHRLPWIEIVDGILDGSIQEIVMELKAQAILEDEVLHTKCRFVLSDTLRAVLLERKERRAKNAYLTAVCQ